MKLGVANLEQLDWQTRLAVEDLERQIAAGWSIEHNGDGSHGAVTAESLTITGPVTTTGEVSSEGGFVAVARLESSSIRTWTQDAGLTPSQITSNQHDYNPADLATTELLRISSDAPRTITGLVPDHLGRWRRIYLMNVGNFTITLAHNSGSSTNGYRFAAPGSVDFPLITGRTIALLYDPHAGTWRILGVGSVIKSRQAITVTIPAGNNTSATGTITAVDTAKSVLVYTGSSGGTSSSVASAPGATGAVLTNATTVTAYRALADTNSVSSEHYVTVLEFH
jgi:hypothetical protein